MVRAWPVACSVFALLVGLPVSAPAGESPKRLAIYMEGLAARAHAWSRAAELAAQDRVEEARASVALLPLPESAGPLPDLSGSVDPVRRDLALARWTARSAINPELAIALYRRVQARGLELAADEAVLLARAFILTGSYDIAAALLDRAIGPDTVAMRQALAQIQDAADPAQLIRLRYQAAGLRVSGPWPALEAWRWTERAPSDRPTKLLALGEFLEDDEGAWLVAEVLVEEPAASVSQVVVARGRLMERSRLAGRLDRMFDYWKSTLREPRLRSEHGRALLEMGRVRARQGRHRDAIALCRKAVERDEQLTAAGAWAVAHSLMAMGRYSEALLAYRDMEVSTPFLVCCTDPGDEAARYALYQGLALEHLGLVVEAAAQYLRAVGAFPRDWHRTLGGHVVDLYVGTGQTAVLDRLAVSLRSRNLVDMYEAKDERSRPLAELSDHSNALEWYLALRRTRDAGDWHSLIAQLHGRGAGGGPEDAAGRADTFQAVEAARLLCTQAEETVPLLIAAGSDRNPWVAYALGRCATPEAVSYLRHALERGHDQSTTPALTFALTLSSRGRQALREASRTVREIEPLLQRFDVVMPFADEQPEFPFPRARSGRLPDKPAPTPQVHLRTVRPNAGCVCM